MIFTWSSENLCIIFSQWRITGPLSLFFSLILIVLLTAGYEGVRNITRKYEAAHNQRLSAFAAVSSTGGRSEFHTVASYTRWLVCIRPWRWCGKVP